jgi:hypothetical protein
MGNPCLLLHTACKTGFVENQRLNPQECLLSHTFAYFACADGTVSFQINALTATGAQRK